MTTRPNWDEYFIGLAFEASKRASCPRRSVGAVLTLKNVVVGTGYNGSRPGEPHCTDAGCLMVDGHCKRTTHAEVNAVLSFTSLDCRGVDWKQSRIYVTDMPCEKCLRFCAFHQIPEIIFAREYRVEYAQSVANSLGIRLRQVGYYVP